MSYSVPPGVKGGAILANGRRHILWRIWGDDGRHLIWIGLNPSTADGFTDDPTIRQECNISRAHGYSGYVKLNVSDFIATDPRFLKGVDPILSSDGDYYFQAKVSGAKEVVVAMGNPPLAVKDHASWVIGLLARQGTRMLCLGQTNLGWPRHSLRNPNRTLVPYVGKI